MTYFLSVPDRKRHCTLFEMSCVMKKLQDVLFLRHIFVSCKLRKFNSVFTYSEKSEKNLRRIENNWFCYDLVQQMSLNMKVYLRNVSEIDLPIKLFWNVRLRLFNVIFVLNRIGASRDTAKIWTRNMHKTSRLGPVLKYYRLRHVLQISDAHINSREV